MRISALFGIYLAVAEWRIQGQESLEEDQQRSRVSLKYQVQQVNISQETFHDNSKQDETVAYTVGCLQVRHQCRNEIRKCLHCQTEHEEQDEKYFEGCLLEQCQTEGQARGNGGDCNNGRVEDGDNDPREPVAEVASSKYV